MNIKLLVTGGSGFMGSAFIRHVIKNTNYTVINIDLLTYASNLKSLEKINKIKRYSFKKIDINYRKSIRDILLKFKPNVIIHFAAETHVDNSLIRSDAFIRTNIFGTFNLISEARSYWSRLKNADKDKFIFYHITTDEVYGDLVFNNKKKFSEKSPYLPNNPYSASKAASDHLIRAWHHSYGLPVIITHCSNNYGPFQNPEKFIPKIITRAIQGKPLPIYGNGKHVRDWLFVDDNAEALLKVLSKGKIGHTYNIGGNNERTNLSVVKKICSILEENINNKQKKCKSFIDLISFIKDRPGHDLRYALNTNKIRNNIGWRPKTSFTQGLRKTVLWYIKNKYWWKNI